MQEKRNDEQIQQAVKFQFLGIAPERAQDLERLWNENDLIFSLLSDEKKEPVIEGGLYREVNFNHRALRVLWVSAFAAWEAYSCMANAVSEGRAKDLRRLRELLELALEIRDTPDYELVPLRGVPEPGTFPDPQKYPHERAASELAVWASGWAMLHEVRHIKHQREGTSFGPGTPSENQRAEELSCDNFATDFLLSNVAAYASSTGEDLALVTRKRRTGIYFAMFALTVLSYPKWDETISHPPLQRRLDATRLQVSGAELDESLMIAHLAFSSLEEVWPSVPAYRS